jgi:pyruvate dehydrogenase E2 component (dihydrolipoamide acetyltransferase)
MASTNVMVPDIGDFKDIPVIEVHVKLGDSVKRDDPLITLESDKAAMEIPSPEAGQVAEILIKLGDKVSQGVPIIRLTTGAASEAGTPVAVTPEAKPEVSSPQPGELASQVPAAVRANEMPVGAGFGEVHAGPSVRRIAREFDIDLTQIKGTGEKGRITKDDVKRALAGPSSASSGLGIPEIPAQDFSKFGPVEIKPMSRLKRLSGPHLHRAWLNIPHVTHCDEADITELDSYRKTLDAVAKDKGYRVTLLAFLLKASVVALKEFPEFNASLGADKESLILKRYYNIGVAVDTPDGLVVPVIRDVDRKGILELSQELSTASQKMRDGKIAPADIQGGTFSISSLGGIGGTAFTPIINAPEVAILGVVKSEIKPLWDGTAFQPRLMLPLCLSYDHRVVDGALAARFTRRLGGILEDLRQLVL